MLLKKWHYEVLGVLLGFIGALMVLGAAGTSDTRPEVSLMTVAVIAVIGFALFWAGITLWRVPQRKKSTYRSRMRF